jgi:ribosomal protein L1
VFYSKKTTASQGVTEAQAAAAQVFNFNDVIAAKEVIQKVKEISKERKFPESVEAIIRLNVDPR